MREEVDSKRIEQFMKALGSAARNPASVYLVGGSTAVLLGWRQSTIDIDIKLVPQIDAVLRLIPELKERLRINVELAAPDDFIPELPYWKDRSRFIGKEGSIEFFHYDFYAQALAKIERGHKADRADVRAMVESGLVNPERLLLLFSEIEPQLFRFPALDPPSFRRAVENTLGELTGDQTSSTSSPGS